MILSFNSVAVSAYLQFRRYSSPWTHRALILTLPIVLSVLLPDWRFSRPDHIDPWVYHGYFRHLRAYVTELFPGTYYGTRLGWIVPGQAFYALFDANLASFALHSLFYVAAVLSLYEILRAVCGDRCALAGAILFAFSLESIRALGSDYVDGPVIAYSLLSAALMQRAVRSESPWAAIGSGIAAGAMLHSNVGAAFLVPSILIWLVPFSVSADAWRAAGRGVWQWGLGIALCTIALAQVSLLNGGPWTFFMPSFSFIVRMGTSNPWDRPGLSWILEVPWAFIHIAALVAVVSVIANRARRVRLDHGRVRAVAAWLLTLLIFLAWDYIGPGALWSVPFYASWLAPLSVVAVTAAVLGTVSLSRIGMPAIAIAGAALVLVASEPPWLSLPVSDRWRAGIIVAAALWAGAARSGALSVSLVALVAVVVQSSLLLHPYYPAGDRVDVFRAVDRAVVSADRYIGRTTKVLMLLEDNPPMKRYFDSFASVYLHGYVVISDKYPAVDTPKYAITPGVLVVIVSSHENEGERMQPLFTSQAVVGRIRGEEKIPTRAGMLHLTFVRAEAPLSAGTL